MMNIQFMTRENNEVRKVKDVFGNEREAFVPNYDELIKNASCEEEVEMLENAKKRNEAFAYEIVHTIYTRVLKYDFNTGKQYFTKEWTLYQHPWYCSYEGVYKTKEEMIENIENTTREMQ